MKDPKRNNIISDVVVRFIKALSLTYPKVTIYFGKRDILAIGSSP